MACNACCETWRASSWPKICVNAVSGTDIVVDELNGVVSCEQSTRDMHGGREGQERKRKGMVCTLPALST